MVKKLLIGLDEAKDDSLLPDKCPEYVAKDFDEFLLVMRKREWTH